MILLGGAGIGIVVALVPAVWILLQYPSWTSWLMKGIAAVVAAVLIYFTVRHPDRRERRNMTAYLILTLGSLAFWSLYQMAPSGLQLFADHNVKLVVAGFKVPVEWIQNINTVVVVFGGPLLAALFALYVVGTLAWAARWRALLKVAGAPLPLQRKFR